MRVSFRSKKLETLESKPSESGYPADAVRSFRKRLQFIRAASDERDLRAMRSMRFEKLQGARSHQYSLRLNDQWRLIFEFEDEEGVRTVVVVDIEDYH